MVQFNARITAYDCLDKVQWSIKVWDTDVSPTEGQRTVLELWGTVDGQGHDNPAKWLGEVLLDAAETL